MKILISAEIRAANIEQGHLLALLSYAFNDYQRLGRKTYLTPMMINKKAVLMDIVYSLRDEPEGLYVYLDDKEMNI